MNADDRQVIREALDNLYPSERETIEDQQSFDKLKDKAIALLDKPQPESAGDARELRNSIAQILVRNHMLTNQVAIGELAELVNRIRSEALEGALNAIHARFTQREPSAWAWREQASIVEEVLRSLSTGTP